MRSSQGDMRYSSSPIQSDVRSCQGDVRYSYAHKFVMCADMRCDVRFSGTPLIKCQKLHVCMRGSVHGLVHVR